MNTTTLFRALVVAWLPAWALTTSPALAAHAGDAYRNADHSNDVGDHTGDSHVEGLNSRQLDENYRGPAGSGAPAANPSTARTPPACAPR